MTDVLMDIFTPEKPKEKCGDNEREYFIQKLKELQDKLPAYKPAQSEPPFYIPTPIPPSTTIPTPSIQVLGGGIYPKPDGWGWRII